MRLTLMLFCCLVVITGCEPPPFLDAPGPDSPKSKTNPNGVSSVSQLAQEDGYYLVKGADLHNVGGDLIGKNIRVRGTIRDMATPLGGKTILVETDDNCYYVQVVFGSSAKKTPEELRAQLEKGGLQKGNPIELWCTVDSIAQESGWLKSALKYKSCIVYSVDKWKR